MSDDAWAVVLVVVVLAVLGASWAVYIGVAAAVAFVLWLEGE